MKESDFPDSVMNGAYKIFLEETRKHIAETRSSFGKGSDIEKPELEDAKVRFHRIRGGAGFFGLTDVEEKASKLETMLKESGEEIVKNLDTVRDLILSLEKSVREIPDKSAKG